MKKLLGMLLVALLLLSLTTAAFAHRIESLDSSAIDGSTWMIAGTEDELYIYPYPRSAAAQFDIRSASIVSSNEKVLGVAPGKRDTYEYGFVVLIGKRTGVSTVTVTDPGSGASCSIKVYVLPQFLNAVMNFLVAAQTALANLRIAVFNAFAIHI